MVLRYVCWWWYNDRCVGDGTTIGALVMVLRPDTYPDTQSCLLRFLHKIKRISSSNIMGSDTPFLTTSAIAFTSMRNRYGLTADHWCN